MHVYTLQLGFPTLTAERVRGNSRRIARGICTDLFTERQATKPVFVLKKSAIPFAIGRFTPSIRASVRIGSCINTLLLVHLMGVLRVLMGAVRTSRRWLTISTVGIVTAAATSSAST